MKQALTLPTFEGCLPEGADSSVYQMAKKLDQQVRNITTSVNAEYTTQVVETIQNWCVQVQQTAANQPARTVRAAG